MLLSSYSDIDEHQLLCYQLEEKMRTVLMQRMQPRDFTTSGLLEQHGMDAAFHMRFEIRMCQ
jgi:hypothetical protein